MNMMQLFVLRTEKTGINKLQHRPPRIRGVFARFSAQKPEWNGVRPIREANSAWANASYFSDRNEKRHRAWALCPYIDHMCTKIKLNKRETIFGISNHRAFLFPKWISATKPGPVWAPMTGPIES